MHNLALTLVGALVVVNSGVRGFQRQTSLGSRRIVMSSMTMMMSSEGREGGGRGGGGGRGRGSGRGGGAGGGRGGGGGGRGNRNRNRKRGPAGDASTPDSTPMQKHGKTIPSVRDLESRPPTAMVSATNPAPAPTAARTAVKAGAALKFSTSRFADLNIDSNTRRAMAETFQYEFMTPVQEETLPHILDGKDCLAKAKTGTGKTLGFLIPTIDRVLSARARKGTDRSTIPTLILSPTRELASQIAAECEALLSFQSRMRVVTVVGGTNIKKDMRNLEGQVDFLVATPGRLLDHLQQGLVKRLDDLSVLIMDEADQLLDMGFRPDIERILALLAKSKAARQTLLFSATVPKTVIEIAKLSLHPGYSFVDTVGEEEEQTHKHVKQECVVVPNECQIANIAAVLDRECAKPGFKIIVFFTTARVTGFMAELFVSMGLPVLEIHSRLSQSARTKTSDKFKNADSAILFSSDVSARGMDYPDVTFVLQVGLTEREQYIHRLGRTARAGKSGSGMIMLAPYEERIMRRDLSDMPLVNYVPTVAPAVQGAVDTALSKVNGNPGIKQSAQQAYGAWLGYYNGNTKKCGFDKPQLVQEANKMAMYFGLREQPTLQKKTVGKMGLKGVPGLKVE